MQRIDGPSASATLPSPNPVGTGAAAPGYFTHGNPTASPPVPGTTLDPDWCNMVQEELVAVVLAAGLTLNKSNHAQLLAAMNALYQAKGGASFTPPATTGGNWTRVAADGWIEMGGIAPAPTSEGAISINFPTAFPTACLGISVTVINSGASATGDTVIQEVSLTPSLANLFCQDQTTGTISDAAGGLRWRAWGY